MIQVQLGFREEYAEKNLVCVIEGRLSTCKFAVAESVEFPTSCL